MVYRVGLENRRGVKASVGSNPTPSAMPLNRQPTLINKGFAVLRGALKRAFSGQVSLKVSLLGPRRHYPNEGIQKAMTTRRMLPSGSQGRGFPGHGLHIPEIRHAGKMKNLFRKYFQELLE